MIVEQIDRPSYGFAPSRPWAERRFAILPLAYELLFGLLQQRESDEYQLFALLPNGALPEDCFIVEVYNNNPTRTFCAVVCSEHFAPVPLGSELPTLGPVEAWHRKIKKEWLET